MYIEELKGGSDLESGEEGNLSTGDSGIFGNIIAVSDAKRALIGAGARALFYPTLLYNVVRNKIQAEFRWWDKVDEVRFLLLVVHYVFSVIFMLLFFMIHVVVEH